MLRVVYIWLLSDLGRSVIIDFEKVVMIFSVLCIHL